MKYIRTDLVCNKINKFKYCNTSMDCNHFTLTLKTCINVNIKKNNLHQTKILHEGGKKENFLFQKILSKKFSTEKSNNKFHILSEYKKKIDDSLFIFEEIFTREFKSKNEIIEYFEFQHISKNMSLENQISLDSLNQSILVPCWDMINRGGKRWRPMLGLMISDIFKINLDNPGESENKKLYYKLLYLVESLHNASLILDDVEDKSELRRNLPCVHLKYGEPIAINAGISLMFFPFYKIIQNIKDNDIISKLSLAYFQELSGIHIGQGWDIEMKINNRTPTVNNYKDTVLMKTGVFPRLIIKLLHIMILKEISLNNVNNANDLSEIKNLNSHINFVNEIFETLKQIVDDMGIAFQIKDDLLNITESQLAKRKGFFGEDIFEGKLTLMILHTLNLQAESPENQKKIDDSKKRLKDILEINTKDQKLIHEAVNILNSNGSLKFAEEIMNKHVDKSIELCDELIEKIEKSNEKILFNCEAIRNIKTLIFYLIDRSI